jgi:phytoene dehydrogenase-like protein
MNEHRDTLDLAVVGAGLAGLAAAALAARRGKRVVVLEKARTIGGRAGTQVKNGFFFNQGPHALYRGGPGIRLLRSLGIEPKGGMPDIAGSFAVDRGRLHTLPGGFVSLLTTGLLSLAGKIEFGRFLGRLPSIEAGQQDRTTVEAWLAAEFRDAGVRRVVRALLRLSTYAADTQRMSAGLAIRQMQSVGAGVLYLNGGWQTLVDALGGAAHAAGGTISCSARVDAIEPEANGHRLRLADGEVRAHAVIVATTPEVAAEIVAAGRHDGLRESVASLRPIRAACLDLALASTPRPKAKFALGIDRPLYFSLHSAAAELAPPGGALIHAAKYLGGDDADDAGDAAAELEAHVDRLQPGWRDVVVERRLLPNMIVAHDLPSADRGGLAGRIGVAIDDLPGVYLAGDWVGPEAHLADASLASAAAAVDLAVGRGGEPSTAAAA